MTSPRAKQFTPDKDYPELSKHNNHMAKIMTKELYASLRDKKTPSGFTLDNAIQTGVDNPGINVCYSIHATYALLIASYYFIQMILLVFGACRTSSLFVQYIEPKLKAKVKLQKKFHNLSCL